MATACAPLPPNGRVAMATAPPAACTVPLGPPLPGRAGEDGLWAGTRTHWERLGAPGDGRWGALETLGPRALAGEGPTGRPRGAGLSLPDPEMEGQTHSRLLSWQHPR